MIHASQPLSSLAIRQRRGHLDLRDTLLIIHLAGAGVWLGANVVQAVVPPLAATQGREVLAGWYRITAKLSSRLYMPAALTILITGILLVLRSEVYGFDNLFVGIGLGMIVVGAVLGIVVFDPVGKRAAEEIEAGAEGRARASTARLAGFGALDTLLLLFTITVMVLRWGV